MKKQITCLWCHAEFKARTQNHKFCSRECSEAYSRAKNHIAHLDFEYSFAYELAKLEQLGKDYRLPERIIVD
jgi:uncharacterized protein with PIN domain